MQHSVWINEVLPYNFQLVNPFNKFATFCLRSCLTANQHNAPLLSSRVIIINCYDELYYLSLEHSLSWNWVMVSGAICINDIRCFYVYVCGYPCVVRGCSTEHILPPKYDRGNFLLKVFCITCCYHVSVCVICMCPRGLRSMLKGPEHSCPISPFTLAHTSPFTWY